jgi:hypothetical protein
MSIETLCPGCGRKLRVADEHAGRQARCPVCGTIYTVGAGETASSQDSDFSNAAGTGSPVAVETAGQSAAWISSPGGPPGAFLAHGSTPSQPPPSEWYMRTPEGQTYGPVGKADVDRWVGEGRVTAECQLRSGDSDWRPADREYPSLAASRPVARVAPQSAGQENPFAESAMHRPSYAPGGSAYASPGGYTKPHRGVVILILAIMSWVTSCFIFGAIAWAMGAGDIREMKMGRMDDSGLGLTQAGYILGMIHTVIGLLIILAFMLIFVVAIAAS